MRTFISSDLRIQNCDSHILIKSENHTMRFTKFYMMGNDSCTKKHVLNGTKRCVARSKRLILDSGKWILEINGEDFDTHTFGTICYMILGTYIIALI